MNPVHFTRDEPDLQAQDVTGFLAQVNKECQGEWFFRGHRDAAGQWLLPSIGHTFSYAGHSVTFTPRQERALLYRFRRHAYKHYNRVLTEWEALFLARHHELPVRLLDWSTNPVVALYFASTYERDDRALDGAVWAIKRRDHGLSELDVFDDNISPLAVKGIKIVWPFYPTPRLTEQSGVFTLHNDPWTNLDALAGREYPEDELDIERLKRWIVPRERKQGIVQELERLAVNTRSLFPDLDGLARGLWQSEVLRSRQFTF
ncbi:MAG: FRG domain-containing protein [Verrucomicrobiia bacterium]